MSNRRVDSRPRDADLAQVVRLVDAKSSRKEATPPDDGIRPTREGPWDPCRYQEYEVSPEFRQKIMAAKLPQVDPAIFLETMPPTRVAEILAPETSSKTQDPKSEPDAAQQPTRALRSSGRRARIRALVIAGACLGLLLGFLASLSRKGPAHPAIARREPANTSSVPVSSVRAAERLAEFPTSKSSPVPSVTGSSREPSVARLPSQDRSSATGAPTASSRNDQVSNRRAPSHQVNVPKVTQKKPAKPSEDFESAWVEPK